MSLEDDLPFMRRALALAERGGRAVSPNPMVGCVLVKGGRVIAEGRHRRFGGPHAEAEALAKAGARARGATMYVTLEPCVAHAGKKTPPCAAAAAAAGLRRVVVAVRDPNPAVAGRGLSALRRVGARVEVGLCAGQAERLNRGFFSRMRRGRPWVILKAALSLDGRMACANGRSQWITGSSARKAAHRMRAESDAVLVGAGTVLADDPRLTSRLGGRQPLRVVLDSALRTPPRARILDGRAPTLIFSSKTGRRRNAEVLRAPGRGGRLDLRAVLRELSRRGIGTLLVEGGPTVQAEFLRRGLVDEAAVFISPKLISGADDPNRAPRLIGHRLRKIGDDFLFSGPVRQRGIRRALARSVQV